MNDHMRSSRRERLNHFLTVVLALSLGLGAVASAWLALPAARPTRAAMLCVKPGGGDGCEVAISDALAIASQGDTIQVAAGTYTENVHITQTVTLQGGWAPDFSVRDLSQFTSTIVPADPTFSVVYIDGDSNNPSLVAPAVEGFEINGGRADLGGNHGGGMRIISSDATILSNTIHENSAFLLGGGIWVAAGTVHIEGNRIEDNASLGNGQEAYGGGLEIDNSEVTVLNNVISNNIVTGTNAHGGGIYLSNSPAMIIGNVIAYNVVSGTDQLNEFSFGGGLQLVDSPATMQDNLIAYNRVSGREAYGGGIDATGASIELNGNSVISNTASGNYLDSGFLYHGFGGGLSLRNTDATSNLDTISANIATQLGGGIYNDHYQSLLTVTNGLIRGNQALSGGGIYNVSQIWVDSTEISENVASGFRGGGLFNGGSAELVSTLVAYNLADQGGGIGNYGPAQIAYSELVENSALEEGGAIDNGSALILSHNTFTQNASQLIGGCVSNIGSSFMQAVLTATHTTFRGNYALISGGCIANWTDGEAWIFESTFFENLTPGIGGAIDNRENMVVVNSTLSGNRAQSGGGISNSSQLDLTNISITENEAGYSSADSGVGGGLYNSSSVNNLVNPVNTLIAGNVDLTPNEDVPDCSSDPGTMVSQGNNLVGIIDGCSWTAAPGDLIGNSSFPLDPLIGPLAENGGDSQTHALLMGSPAIDAGHALACPATDQRGASRPVDGDGDMQADCDIGAYEYGSIVAWLYLPAIRR